MIQNIENDPSLKKVDRAYVINTNEKDYQAALSRNNAAKQAINDRQRLDNLEKKFDELLDLIKTVVNK